MGDSQFTSIQDPDVRDEVLKLLAGGMTPMDICKRYHVSFSEIELTAIEEQKLYNYTPTGMGRPELLRHFIARRSIYSTQGWDNKAPRIRAARLAYERGEVELSTGRDGQWIILYALPKKNKEPKTNYFNHVNGAE